MKKLGTGVLAFSMIAGGAGMAQCAEASAATHTKTTVVSTVPVDNAMRQGFLIHDKGSVKQLASGVTSIRVYSDNTVQAYKNNGVAASPRMAFGQEGTSATHGVTTYISWGDVWKYAKCAGDVASAFSPVGKAYRSIKELGGVARTIKLLWGASKASDFAHIAGSAASSILGISSIRSDCF